LDRFNSGRLSRFGVSGAFPFAFPTFFRHLFDIMNTAIIGASGYAGEETVRILSRHPRLKIFVEPGTSSHLYRSVVSGDLDAGLIVMPQFAMPKAFAWKVLVEEPFIVLAPGALAHRDPHDLLRNEPFIRYDRAMWGGMVADRYLQSHNIAPHERLEIDALNAIASMVDAGLGVSLVPDWARPWPEGLDVARIALPKPAPVRRIGLLWSPKGPHAAIAEAFLASVG